MTEIAIDWTSLPTGRLERMLTAGRDVMECHRVLTVTGDNIVGELIKTAGPFYEWTHYPEGDVYDRNSHAQFYYHAHPKDEQRSWNEHGHFHTFPIIPRSALNNTVSGLQTGGRPFKHLPRPVIQPIRSGFDG